MTIFDNEGIQYIPRNMHTVFVLLCFVVVIHWPIFPYPSGLLHWHCGNLTIAPVPAKQPWWIWINTSCEFIMNDCITTRKQSTTKPCAYFLGYTVVPVITSTLKYGTILKLICHYDLHRFLHENIAFNRRWTKSLKYFTTIYCCYQLSSIFCSKLCKTLSTKLKILKVLWHQ